jgi:hypothetical protein
MVKSYLLETVHVRKYMDVMYSLCPKKDVLDLYKFGCI